MSYLRPDNMIIFQQATKFADKVDQKERWYGGEYHEEELRTEFIDELNEIKPKPYFSIPAPNIFMPENFKVNNPVRLADNENFFVIHHFS